MANTTNFSIEKPSVGGARNSWGGIVNVGIDKLDELLALAMPIGTIQMYPLSTAPTQTLNGGTWLVCDGADLLQDNYEDLFSLIGTTYGDGTNAATHFNLPDFQARVPVGYNVATIGTGTVGVRSVRNMATTTGGTEAHILEDDQIPKHLHEITDPGHIHPIDPATTHFHDGAEPQVAGGGGFTGYQSLTINDPKHGHTITPIGHDYYPKETTYSVGYERSENNPTGTLEVPLASTGITIDPHYHSMLTDAKVTGITTTLPNPVRITSTLNQEDGDESHNNMQPYITVQYIILAKHPSF